MLLLDQASFGLPRHGWQRDVLDWKGLSEVAVVLVKDAVLCDESAVLVEPGAAAVAFLVSFEDVGTTVVGADVYANYIVAEEDLSPTAPIAPFFLAALDHAEAIFVAIPLDLEPLASHEVPDVEGTEGLPVLINQPRPLNSILQRKQVRRVVLCDCA